jgi:hypothetical protein
LRRFYFTASWQDARINNKRTGSAKILEFLQAAAQMNRASEFAPQDEKPAWINPRGLFVFIKSGDFLLSHAVSRAVPSAPRGLTSVFGMGTGVTLSTKSPENFSKLESRTRALRIEQLENLSSNRTVQESLASA